MSRAFADLSFTPAVLAIQKQQGSAAGYANFLEPEADAGNEIGRQKLNSSRQWMAFFRQPFPKMVGLMYSFAVVQKGS
jgi:hypothetical protein